MCSVFIFQILLLCSMPMTSHHVTCHVTAMSCASSLLIKRKRKRNSKEKKYKIKKIDNKKRKMLVSKAFYNIHHALECLVIWTTLEYFCHRFLISYVILWAIVSKLFMYRRWDVLVLVMEWMSSLMNSASSLLPLIKKHFLVWIYSSMMGILTVIGVWFNDSLYYGWILWLLNSGYPGQRNTRSKTKLEIEGLSEYLVGWNLTSSEISNWKEPATSKKMSLYWKWCGKFGSQK